MPPPTPTATRAHLPISASVPEGRADQGRVLRILASSENVAKDGGIIELKGLKTDRYMATGGSFLWSHDPVSQPPIGRCLRIEKTNRGLEVDIEFAGDEQAHPFAETAYRLFRAGFLSAVSVGFNVI